MALPRDYAGQRCSLSRTLEIVGERWTMLIMRDAFFGVRRFGDFVGHLGLPRAVLTERLDGLREAGVLREAMGNHGFTEYVLTAKGVSLWPIVREMLNWGDEHYGSKGPRLVFRHVEDTGDIGPNGACEGCGTIIGPADLLVLPGPGYDERGDDFVSKALMGPHRMLQPVRP